MLSTVRLAPANAQKGRPGKSGPITKMLSSNINADTTEALRLQRLRLLGIIGARADLIANLAWGEAA